MPSARWVLTRKATPRSTRRARSPGGEQGEEGPRRLRGGRDAPAPPARVVVGAQVLAPPAVVVLVRRPATPPPGAIGRVAPGRYRRPPAPARRRRCRRRGWPPSGRTTSRRPPGRPATSRRPARGRRPRWPRTPNISTTCAVTSALGGSISSPKSQKGSSRHSVRVLSTSKAAHPPSRHCMPSSQATARSIEPRSAARPVRAGPAPPRPCRRCRGTSRWRTRTPTRRARARAGARSSRPRMVISSSTSHAPPGAARGRPAAGRRRPGRSTASAVSQTGDWQASRRRPRLVARWRSRPGRPAGRA